jgi:PilZ domain
MSRLTPTQAVASLCSAPEVELEVEGGKPITLKIAAVDRTRVTALAPRLRVSAGMALIGRVIGDDERPWMIAMKIERADFHSQALARVELRAQRVGLDTTRRGTVRQPAGGIAWLTAISCNDVLDGDRIDGTMTDLSLTGVGFATSRVLRIGDELEFHGRFFAEEVYAEVRIASLREGSHPGRTIVGARFMALDGTNRARIEHILSGVRPAAQDSGLDVGELRGVVTAIEVDEHTGGWRRVFRRNA